jgi:hypothetical protein
MPTELAGLVSHKEDQLIAGCIVEIHSVKSSAHLNGSQGKLVQFAGTWSEFNNNSSTARWKVMPTTSSTLISLKACNLTLIRVPPQGDEKDWWDFEEQGSIEAGGTAANQIRPVRATGQLLERDIVQIHSLETATYNGHYGKLETYIEEKQRWQVKLDKNDKVIVVKTANLSFIREPHIKPLPGSSQVQLVLDTLQELVDEQDSKSTLRMEFEVIMI